jgi:hypothetical protein
MATARFASKTRKSAIKFNRLSGIRSLHCEDEVAPGPLEGRKGPGIEELVAAALGEGNDEREDELGR